MNNDRENLNEILRGQFNEGFEKGYYGQENSKIQASILLLFGGDDLTPLGESLIQGSRSQYGSDNLLVAVSNALVLLLQAGKR